MRTRESRRAPEPNERDAFHLFIDSVVDYAIFMLDRDGYVVTWNRGAERIKGYRAEEIIGRHFSTFYPSEYLESGVPAYALSVARTHGRWEGEGWRLRADGSRFWASVVITAVRDVSGELVGFGKVTRDLTERQASEEERQALLDAEHAARVSADGALERLQAIQRVTEVGLSHLSVDSLLPKLLARVADVLSADTVMVLLKDGDDLLVTAAIGLEDHVREELRIPIGTGFAGRIALEAGTLIVDDIDQYPVEIPVLREKGVRSLLGVPLITHGEVRGVLHVGSLTPRQFTEDEAELLQLVADRVTTNIEHVRLVEAEQCARIDAITAETTARLREQFLGIAAHELKTPLTVVNGYAQMLRRSLERKGEVDAGLLRTALNEIATHSSRLDNLINDLLETSRISEGRMTIDAAPMDLAQLAQDVVRRFRDGPEGSPAHELVLDAAEPVTGEWDVARLDQVLTNLLSNAMKYSPEGGVVQVSTRNVDGGAEVRVTDQGVGISELAQRELFQPFSRVRSNAHVSSGIGLGLFLSMQFVQRHGGTIEVDSKVGQGSTFTVRLPRIAPSNESSDG